MSITHSPEVLDPRKLIGKRLLCTKCMPYSSRPDTPYELRILEVSPAGLWMRVRRVDGSQFWCPPSAIQILEILVDLRAERAQTEPQPK